MKKRKGFTLIELMIVIAIIIILAAIAIPNYLRMTDRARRARVAGDFTSVATALEAFSVDWGSYPNTPGTPSTALTGSFGKDVVSSVIEDEITAGATAVINLTGNTTLTGEDGGIEYIKTGTVNSMYNPFAPNDKNDYFYASSPSGTHWILGVQYNSTDVLYKTDMLTDLKQGKCADVTGISIGNDGTIGGIT